MFVPVKGWSSAAVPADTVTALWLVIVHFASVSVLRLYGSRKGVCKNKITSVYFLVPLSHVVTLGLII